MTHHHTSFISTPKQPLKKLTLLGLCAALPLLTTGCATNNSVETNEAQTVIPVVTEQAQALYEQGLELFNGEDTAQNKKQAFELFHKAALDGHTEAQGMLVNMYASGQGVIVDYKEAAKWAHKAAEKGHFEAQFMLGIMYRNGKGVAKDRGQAIRWLKKAVEKGDPNIQVMLGTLYFEEEGSDNKKRAVKLFQSASDQDNAEGHFALGVAYGSGIGIAKNEELSGKLIKEAAKKNSAGAQIVLAKSLIHASGVENNKKAVYWLKKAADSGNFKAKMMLDKMKEGQLTVKTSEQNDAG